MKIIKIISRVRPNGFIRLIRLCATRVWFIWPTYKATKSCMRISTAHFGRQHYRNGQANAFRHALWNILIALGCGKVSSNIEKVVLWTKSITDWHEETFFSQELPMKMDYHNNEVGRLLFHHNQGWTELQFVNELLKLLESAKQIKQETPLNLIKNQLVYISNDTEG